MSDDAERLEQTLVQVERGDVPEATFAEQPPDRITVAGAIYHQSLGTDGTQVNLKFERLLETREQVFFRCLRAGSEWLPLIPDRCWLQGEQVGLVVVRNDEGRHSLVQLSPEEKNVLRQKQLLVAVSPGGRDNPLVVRSGECFPLSLRDPQGAQIRSSEGEIRYTIYVFPR